MRRRSTIAAQLAAFAGLVLLLAWPFVHEAAATEVPCTQFATLAAADGVRALGASPGFALVEEADAAAPGAQAYADASGRSEAYAGYPYPGSTALSALALAGVPASTVPLVVQSSNPAQPQATTSAPGVTLAARSDDRASTATAAAGSPSGGGSDGAATSGAARAGCADDGTVTASSESVGRSLSFAGDTIRIGEVRAVAQAAVEADGKPKLSSKLVVSGLVVLGQEAALTDNGLVLAGASTPAPDDPFAAGLRDAGVTVTYLAASTDADGAGVVAPGLQIAVRRQAIGTAPTEVVYTFGRSYARATSGAATADASGVAGGSPAVPQSLVATAGNAGSPASATSSSGVSAAPRIVATIAGNSLDSVSTARIYPVLVVGAAALLVGATFLRRTQPKKGAP